MPAPAGSSQPSNQVQQSVPLEFGSSPVAIVVPIASCPRIVLDDDQSLVDHGPLMNESSGEHVKLIRQRARELLQFTGGPASPMPGKPSSTYALRVTDSDLDAMLGLSQDILTNLERIVAARKREDNKRLRVEGAQTDYDDEDDDDEDDSPERLKQSGGRHKHQHQQRKYSNTRLVCHMCGIVSTPQWRVGPDGPGTLCNVCGLVYARRSRANTNTKLSAYYPRGS